MQKPKKAQSPEPPKETIYETLRRRLAEVPGMHRRIALDCGIAQSSVSRYQRGLQIPGVLPAQAMLTWFEKFDKERAALAAINAKYESMKVRARGKQQAQAQEAAHG